MYHADVLKEVLGQEIEDGHNRITGAVDKGAAAVVEEIDALRAKLAIWRMQAQRVARGEKNVVMSVVRVEINLSEALQGSKVTRVRSKASQS